MSTVRVGRCGCPLVTHSHRRKPSGSPRAVQNAERISGLTFSVYVGVSEEDSRAYAERLHGALEDLAHSVLVMCDPPPCAGDRHGKSGRRLLDDVECRLAAAAMRESFVADDIVGGLAHGISQLERLRTNRPRCM